MVIRIPNIQRTDTFNHSNIIFVWYSAPNCNLLTSTLQVPKFRNNLLIQNITHWWIFLQEDQILTKAIMEKINLAQLIRETRSSEQSFCLKLLVVLPSLSPESRHRPFCEMIKKKLSKQGKQNLYLWKNQACTWKKCLLTYHDLRGLETKRAIVP